MAKNGKIRKNFYLKIINKHNARKCLYNVCLNICYKDNLIIIYNL